MPDKNCKARWYRWLAAVSFILFTVLLIFALVYLYLSGYTFEIMHWFLVIPILIVGHGTAAVAFGLAIYWQVRLKREAAAKLAAEARARAAREARDKREADAEKLRQQGGYV
jgi:type VI protein secretion system component VasK